jgi:hypothetical protein
VTQGRRKGKSRRGLGFGKRTSEGKQSNVELLISLSRREGRIRQAGGKLRRRQALRRAVLAVGGERGARVGRQQQRARAVRSREATRGRGGTGDGRR